MIVISREGYRSCARVAPQRQAVAVMTIATSAANPKLARSDGKMLANFGFIGGTGNIKLPDDLQYLAQSLPRRGGWPSDRGGGLRSASSIIISAPSRGACRRKWNPRHSPAAS